MIDPRVVLAVTCVRQSVAAWCTTAALLFMLLAPPVQCQASWSLDDGAWTSASGEETRGTTLLLDTNAALPVDLRAGVDVTRGTLALHVVTPTLDVVAPLDASIGTLRNGEGSIIAERGVSAIRTSAGTWEAQRFADAALLDQIVIDGANALRVSVDAGVLDVLVNGALMARVAAPALSSAITLELRGDANSRARVDGVVFTHVLAENATEPSWIWDDARAADDETLFFRRRFDINDAPHLAELVLSCDNVYDAYVDGEHVGHSKSWERPLAYDVTELLEDSGTHVLAIRAYNVAGPGALVARLALHADGGAKTTIDTDASWRVASAESDSWTDVDFDDSAWSRAHVVTSLGGAPYGAVTLDAFDRAAQRDAPQATDVAQLTVPPGFEVELLHTAASHEGSWVSLCVDDRGRLIASDQQGAGLFRITLGADTSCEVEPLALGISRAQGLLWLDDSLYVMVHGGGEDPGGLYRAHDTTGDDTLDTVVLLKTLNGTGEHGWHSLVAAPDGKSIFVVAGNNVDHPAITASRVPLHWTEGQLLARVPDPTGFMAGTKAPGGAIYRTDLHATRWKLVSMGYRNPYDAAFDAHGELFTFDADMEWDVNTPWYRPTRVCRVTSGSEYGWRAGSGKWPAWYPDSLPGELDIGPGSPVGITFGHRARFPAKYRNALFLGDWSYGRIYAAHVSSDARNEPPTFEPFMTGIPFPVTDMVVHPDGALYIVTGGRGVPTGLYRVRYTGSESVEAPRERPALHAHHVLRRELEALHGQATPDAVDLLWPHLGHSDHRVRFAARIALEWQPVDTWRARALAERDASQQLSALLALVRAGTPSDSLASDVHRALGTLQWPTLSTRQRLDLVRIESLALSRLGTLDGARRISLVARYIPHFPSDNADLDAVLCTLLVALDDPTLASRVVPRIASTTTAIERMALLSPLRLLTNGWTPELRREYFTQLGLARASGGGASLAGYVDKMRDDALERSAESDVEQDRATYDAARATDTGDLDAASFLAGRTTSTDWAVPELARAVEARLDERNFHAGRRAFSAVKCFTCHRINGSGGTVGPDLTGAGRRFGVRELVEAMVEPSKVLSDLYAPSLIVKTDGSVVTGQIGNLHGATLDVIEDMTRPERVTRIARPDIESIRRTIVSPMPEGLLAPLTADEIADLVAFLLAGGDADDPAYGERDDEARRRLRRSRR